MNRSSPAFSLIELLLAMTIFAVVAVCIYGTFAAGMKLNQRSEGENAAYRQMRVALDLLTTDLENTVPYDFTGSYPDQSAFEGEKDRITFILSSQDGLKVVRYYLESPEEGSIHKVIIGKRYARNVNITADYREENVPLRNLVREEWDFPAYLGDASGANHPREIIATGIREGSLNFFFGYLLETGGSRGSVYEWRDQWRQTAIPLMVRVRMEFLLSGPAPRLVTLDKDILIPHGSWGRPEKS